MIENVTKDGIVVEKEQVWRDLDKRAPIRHAKVIDIRDGKAIMFLCTPNGRLINATREIKIAITRMHKHSTGWGLVLGANGKNTTVAVTSPSTEQLAQFTIED